MSDQGMVTGYLGKDAKEELEDYCEEADIPVSRFVTRAVNRELVRQEVAFMGSKNE
jgi:hypothetical protein